MIQIAATVVGALAVVGGGGAAAVVAGSRYLDKHFYYADIPPPRQKTNPRFVLITPQAEIGRRRPSKPLGVLWLKSLMPRDGYRVKRAASS
jgi:hypothetical protein